MQGRFGCVLSFVFIFLVCVGAWLQHVYTCFITENWGFLIAGAMAFPIAIVHGIGIWFNLW